MSRSHGRATAQNFAEFAQNLEMCTPKLEKSCSFTIFTCFLYVCAPFMWLFGYFSCIFLRKIFKNLVLTAQKNLLLECLALGMASLYPLPPRLRLGLAGIRTPTNHFYLLHFLLIKPCALFLSCVCSTEAHLYNAACIIIIQSNCLILWTIWSPGPLSVFIYNAKQSNNEILNIWQKLVN